MIQGRIHIETTTMKGNEKKLLQYTVQKGVNCLAGYPVWYFKKS